MFCTLRPRWGLTWRGRFVIAFLIVAAALVYIRGIHPFLALTAPVAADTLVIEGWIPEYAIRDCAPLIRTGSYQRVFTVGGPVASADIPAPADDTRAYVAAMTLQRAGIDPRLVTMVPTTRVPRDRTYTCALSLKRWLDENRLSPRGINVVTLGPHARRSRLLFEKAFGSVPVGILALPNREYDAAHWWRYSEGVKEVVSEAAAYVYARFWFSP